MAIASLNITPLSRSAGRNACQKASYNAGCKITDKTTNQTFDNEDKADNILHSEILRFEGSRDDLYSMVEASETRKNSCVIRDGFVALPHELSLEKNIELMREMGNFIADRYQVFFDFSIHSAEVEKGTDSRNTHCHFMFSVRRMANNSLFDADGKPNEKTRELDEKQGKAKRDENGEVIKNELGKTVYEPGRGSIEIELLRSHWQKIVNAKLEQQNIEARIDMRSYRRQGVDKIAGVHLGKHDTDLERVGIKTERGEHNRAAAKYNMGHDPKYIVTVINPRDAIWKEFKELSEQKRAAEKAEKEKLKEVERAKYECKRLEKSANRYATQRNELKAQWKKENRIKAFFNSDGFKKDAEYMNLSRKELKVLKLVAESKKGLPQVTAKLNAQAEVQRKKERTLEDKMVLLAAQNPFLQKYVKNAGAVEQMRKQLAEALKTQPRAVERPTGLRKPLGHTEQPSQQHRATQRPGMRP